MTTVAAGCHRCEKYTVLAWRLPVVSLRPGTVGMRGERPIATRTAYVFFMSTHTPRARSLFLVHQVMGLLAYKDPADSPLGYLVSGLQNQAIADKVNDAVLGENKKRPDRVGGCLGTSYRSHLCSGPWLCPLRKMNTRTTQSYDCTAAGALGTTQYQPLVAPLRALLLRALRSRVGRAGPTQPNISSFLLSTRSLCRQHTALMACCLLRSRFCFLPP